MRLFPCRACLAKDDEIAHLIAQLDKLNAQVERMTARVAEIASPGSTRRAAAPIDDGQRRDNAPPKKIGKWLQTLPGYELEFQEEVEIT